MLSAVCAGHVEKCIWFATKLPVLGYWLATKGFGEQRGRGVSERSCKEPQFLRPS